MGIIFVVFAIIFLMRRPKIKQLVTAQYPNVSQTEFERWKRLELLSIDIFLVCAFIPTILVTVAALIPSAPGPPASGMMSVFIMIASFGSIAIFVVGLIVSAIIGSIAARVRKTLNIVLP